MPLEADIIARIEADFSFTDAPSALQLLIESKRTGRLARCIILAASGQLDLLRHYVAMADMDSRDVIVAGEYDPGFSQIRDLRASFLIDAREKLWIADVAAALQTRGFVLRSLESRRATAGPFECTADESEGVAEFIGTHNLVKISKSDRQWALHEDAAKLEPYELHVPFEDEAKFRDAVSCYLLALQIPTSLR